MVLTCLLVFIPQLPAALSVHLFFGLVDNMASVVWVWDTQKMSLEAVLEQTSAVRCFQWDPRRPRLALCTGNSRLYLWTPAGCVSVQVPTEGMRLAPSQRHACQSLG